MTIKVTPVTDPPFQIRLQGGQSNLVVGSFCETTGGRNTCDPSVALLDAGGSPLCTVRRSSYTINSLRLGFPPLGSTITDPFVYSVSGNYSVQCFGEASPFTGTFSLNQTTTTKFQTEPLTNVDVGTARCNGEGGWPNIGTTDSCTIEPPIPTAELPRGGTISVSFSSDAKGGLGGVPPNKSFRLTQADGPWFSFLRSVVGPQIGDYDGEPPIILQVGIEPTANSRARTGLFDFSVKQRHFELAEGITEGTFTFADGNAEANPHFVIQVNLDFCTGGVISTYTVNEYTFDCEWAKGGILGATVHSVPHLTSFNVTFSMKCGNEGTYRGTIALKDDPGFDCGFPPPAGGGGGGTGGTGDGDIDGGGGTSGGGGGTDGGSGSGGSTGGGGSTSSSAPRVSIPTEVLTDGVVLNNQQSATVNLTTSVSSSFNADVELAAFSEPEGLTLTLSKSAIAAPGAGTSVLTIAAGPDTRPQDYRVLVSATGNGQTTYSVIKVSVLCDPPMILGLDQPKNTTIAGGSATLEVKTLGSGPVIYQWYAGQSGATTDPIEGATGRTFTTSAPGNYWVRATNPCGSVDSNTATVQ
jgi:hypothetical protein